MGAVGEKLFAAVQQGSFYCEVCETDVELSDVSGFDEAREQVLEHTEENHE